MFNFFPVFYTFKSRILTKSERISWFIIFPLYLFTFQYFSYDETLGFLLSFLGILSIYEVGYLYNDFITIRKEVNPTIRAGGFESTFFLHFKYHVLFRLFFGFSLSFYLHSYHLFIYQVALLVTYYLHNTIRNRFNIITYLFLVSERYLGVLSPLGLSLLDCLIVTASFPICRTIEHSCKKKYQFSSVQKFVGDVDLFRIKYYTVFLSASLFLYLLNLVSLLCVISSLYFFLYRTSAFFARSYVKRNKHQSY